MKLVWSAEAWEDYLFWQANDPAMVRKINELVCDIRRAPFSGIGKPEALKADLNGWWSRRITGEHRLVYRLRGSGADQALEIIMCRFHYAARGR
jgi:toxin YoeB